MWYLEKPSHKLQFWDWATSWGGLLGLFFGCNFYIVPFGKFGDFPKNNVKGMLIGAIIGRIVGLIFMNFFPEQAQNLLPIKQVESAEVSSSNQVEDITLEQTSEAKAD